MRRRLLACLATLALGSCATYWHKEGSSQAELEKDMQACRVAARNAAPLALSGETVAFYNPRMPMPEDNAAMREEHQFQKCMFDKGYRVARGKPG